VGVANLAISAVCNQNCAYCFTVDHLKRTPGSDDDHPLRASQAFIPVPVFRDHLAFLARSGVEEVRLLGGEPTLHPAFGTLVEHAMAAGMRIVVFTNGLMPEPALSCLEALAPDECTVLVNVNEPTTADDGRGHERRLDTLRRLGKRAFPGFNIYRLDCQLDFLLPLIAETGCKPVVRLGMAQPCLSGNNQHVHPNQYRAVAVKIVRFARDATRAGVTLDFDCGFVRCMFSDADLKTLQAAGTKVGWRCNPILDVDIEGNVLHCYPLANLVRVPLLPESDAASLRSLFEAQTRPYRQAGVFKECSTCFFKEKGECPGGCLAATIRRFRRVPFCLEVSESVGKSKRGRDA
jgi:MoaA/NifB/PqqE/SkfB family radical SAM enzyme